MLAGMSFKDATLSSQKQHKAMNEDDEECERGQEEKKSGNENSVSLLVSFPAQSQWHSAQPCLNRRLWINYPFELGVIANVPRFLLRHVWH